MTAVSEVEVNVPDSILEMLFDIVAEQWKYLGTNRPHHSVLSATRYLPENLTKEALEEFYRSGEGEVGLLVKLAEKNSVNLNRHGVCVELGCGVGRATIHLAKYFRAVIGIDVSMGNLQQCVDAINRYSAANVTLAHLAHPAGLKSIPKADVIFSRIVLQHNPPPVQLKLVSAMLQALQVGGVALFQTIVSGIGYGYSVDQHLSARTLDDFEMHAVPMKYIFEAIHDNDCQTIDVVHDMAGGYNVTSYTFLVQKRFS
jgi:SAM-dependent methyltransferase